MTFLRNCWYLAAWSSDVPVGMVVPRVLLGEPVVLFRMADGNPAALLDRCPHRFAPLSAGTHEGSSIRCRYHGLSFDGNGQCSSNPHGPVTGGMRVKSYPVTERFRGIWIWMGDPAQADPAKLPDLSFLEETPETAFNCGYLYSKAHYELSIDNVLDLSHIDFLHPNTLGGGTVTNTKAIVEQLSDGIDIKWISPGQRPSPLLASLLGDVADETDVWQEVRWWAPAIIRLRSGAVEKGKARSEGYENVNVHIVTPETTRTSHYLFAATRNYRVDDEALNAQIAEARHRIFSTEDSPMIEACQDRMGDNDFWSMKPLLLPIDRGPAVVRRMLQRMIDRENEIGTEPG